MQSFNNIPKHISNKIAIEILFIFKRISYRKNFFLVHWVKTILRNVTIFRKKSENTKVFGEKCRKPCKKGLKKEKKDSELWEWQLHKHDY